MSEQSSFDPLAEARKNADPQRRKFYEVIGSDSEANADYAAYLETRHYKDARGNIHDPKNGEFVAATNLETDPYERDLIESAHAEALVENEDRSASLQAMAEKVAELRARGDSAGAARMEELFYDKFTALSEKYGWDKEVTEDTEEPRVDAHAPLTRTTIEDRLQRYADIMYGTAEAKKPGAADTSVEAEAPAAAAAPEAAAAAPAAEKGADEEVQEGAEPSAEVKKTTLTMQEAFAGFPPRHPINDDLDEIMRAAPVSPANIDVVPERGTLVDPSVFEGLPPRLSDAEGPAAVEKTAVKEAVVEADDKAEPAEAENQSKGRLAQLRQRFSDAVNAPGRKLGAYLAARRNGETQSAEDAEGEKKSRKKLAVVLSATAALALAGGYLAYKYGFDGNGAAEAVAEPSAADTGEKIAENSLRIPDAYNIADHVSPEQLAAFDIPRGSGGEALMNRLGVDPKQWYTFEDELLQKFPNDFYRMSDGHVGLMHPGEQSPSVIGFIADKVGIYRD